ncbi:MAG: DUF4760 domain-containing protein [Candidatus Thorarchaeota archaeon]
MTSNKKKELDEIKKPAPTDLRSPNSVRWLDLKAWTKSTCAWACVFLLAPIITVLFFYSIWTQYSPEQFEAVSSIAGLASLIIALFAVVAASLRLQEAAKARHLDATWLVLKELSKEDAREKRRKVNNEIYDMKKGELKEGSPEFEVAWDVWRLLNDVGLMIHFGMIDDRPILEQYYDSIITLWDSLEHHIIHEREERKNERYVLYFQLLNERAWRWQKKYKLPMPKRYKRRPPETPSQK